MILGLSKIRDNCAVGGILSVSSVLTGGRCHPEPPNKTKIPRSLGPRDGAGCWVYVRRTPHPVIVV